jgi:regulator of cell morphogenesis and NO signaling
MPQLDRSASIAQIVTENSVTARVFQKYGIDYCCHGNVSVPEACQPKRLEPEALYRELEAILDENAGAPQDDPRTLSTAALIARIVDRHHSYLRRALPYIAPLALKVAKVHGAHNPKLIEVEAKFRTLAEALIPHLEDEEEVLFPALMARSSDWAVVRREMGKMHEEHLQVGDLLAKLRELSDEFTTPEWGCNTYRVLMAELDGLERDILQHVHIENHVLAPRFAERVAAA